MGALTAQCMSCWKSMSMEEFCASPASAGVPGCASSSKTGSQAHEEDSSKMCCKAFTAKCVACARGVSVQQICSDPASAKLPGCPVASGTVSPEVSQAPVSVEQSGKCCLGVIATCIACKKGLSVEALCADPRTAGIPGCPRP